MNVIPSSVVVAVVPVLITATRPPPKPSNVHIPGAVPEAHSIVTAFVMHRDAAPPIPPTAQGAPVVLLRVYGVSEGARWIVSPTSAQLKAVIRFGVSIVCGHTAQFSDPSTSV